MSKNDFILDFVRLQVGMIIEKGSGFRASLFTDISVSKPTLEPILYFTNEEQGQRLEVHPNSIQEIINVEEQDIYYLILKRRPTLKTKDTNLRDYWNQDSLEFQDEDPLVALILPFFLVLRLEFSETPAALLRYFEKMRIKRCLGFFSDTTKQEYPIDLSRRFWKVPWCTKYSIFILLTNRKMTIDDLTEENLIILSKIKNCDKLLESFFFTNKDFSLDTLQEASVQEIENQFLPDGHVTVRKILVSPNCITFMPHEIDLGNRAIRGIDTDFFIRVNFVDEYDDRSVWSKCKNVLHRFKDLLRGFSLLGRYFEFFGFSNSQMRNHSCWMVAPCIKFNGDTLRESFGSFDNITSVCKYASRLGLCFSGTHGTITIEDKKVFEIQDIKRNGYNFSDGIGIISLDLFQSVLKSIYIKENQTVSALQIRICGCKGVVAVDPNVNTGIYIRESMNKFISYHTRLELCTYAVNHPGFLNRQIILILNGLGIQNSVFLELQHNMINEIKLTLSSEEAAKNFLKKTYSFYYKDLIYMLENNMKMSEDAYLRKMINSIFLANFKLIKSKARILAPNSRLLMGVLDEYGVLEYGEVFIQLTEGSDHSIIQSKIAIAKNPCYHPGDIRVLTAVDKLELHHLHNVVVFPQKGDRPHPNECSGSDLDGDLYFVTWNPDLVPRADVEPMDYKSPGEKTEKNPNMIEKVIDFFGTFMESENIGRISNAHLVWADLKGIFSDEAIELARLTSVAVDFPKTGVPADLPFKLSMQKWPDFMEKNNKPSYESSGIIGVLWRDCVLEDIDLDFEPVIDKRRVLRGYEKYLGTAKRLYSIYTGKLRKLIYQYDSQNEFYLLTGQTGEHSKKKMRYDDNLQIQALVSTYKEEVLKIFLYEGRSVEERRLIASACYHFSYSKKKGLLSFPWIFYEYLVY